MVHEPSEKGGPPTPRRPGPPVSSFLAVLSKKASHVSKKLRPHNNDKADLNHGDDGYDDTPGAETVKPQRSTMRTPITHRPKELLTSVSNKAIRLIHGRKRGDAGAEPEENLDEEEDFGDGGVWQKKILMGGRCQPLDFSGEICYDENGRKLDHLRSPRASHMQGYLAGPNS